MTYTKSCGEKKQRTVLIGSASAQVGDPQLDLLTGITGNQTTLGRYPRWWSSGQAGKQFSPAGEWNSWKLMSDIKILEKDNLSLNDFSRIVFVQTRTVTTVWIVRFIQPVTSVSEQSSFWSFSVTGVVKVVHFHQAQWGKPPLLWS